MVFVRKFDLYYNSYLWPTQPKNDTLWDCTYLYSRYKGVPPRHPGSTSQIKITPHGVVDLLCMECGKPPILIIILCLLSNSWCHFQSFSNARKVGFAGVSFNQKLKVFQYLSTTSTVIAVNVSRQATESFEASVGGRYSIGYLNSLLMHFRK